MDSFTTSLWPAFLNYLTSQSKIEVPADFRTRIGAIRYVLDSDCTGLINTCLDYSINTASQADFTIECTDDTLRALLNEWLLYVNLDVKGVPTGIQEFAKEYYKERWREGSFILARCGKWKNFTINNTTIKMPTVLWLVNSQSIYVKRNKDQYKLGTDKFYLDSAFEKELPAKNKEGQDIEKIVIQRPFDRVWTEYATPYLIRKGVYRNYKALEMLQQKTEELLAAFVPYLFALTKGTERMFLEGKVEYSDPELKAMNDKLKEELKKNKTKKGETPVWTKPFDTKAEHIMPDLRGMLSEELFAQGTRALLAGLGFVDVIQGITSTRREAILNPKPFIEEVNAGVDGFKSLLREIIYMIVDENKIDHRKLLSRNKKFYIANTPLKINIDPIQDALRSSFVYGAISIKTYQEILGIDPDTEKERMEDEIENKDRELFYPHLVQNREDLPDITPTVKKPPVTKKELEKDVEKEKSEIKENLEIAPYQNLDELPNYIKKLTKHCQEVFMATFNSVYEDTRDEGKSFAIANSAARRCMKKQGYNYDKETKTWKK